MCAKSGQYRASKALGIPQTTLARWVKKSGIGSIAREKMRAAHEAREARITELRSSLRHRLLEEAHYCMDAIHHEHIDFKSAGKDGIVEVTFPVAPAAAVQHYATSAGILIDKFRLESGEVTSRDEHRNISESELDRDINSLLAEMARREEGRAQEPADGVEIRLEQERAAEAAVS